MKVVPSERIVALKVQDKTLSSSGLEVVESNKPEIGEVVSFGTGDKPVDFMVGSLVFYRKFGEFKFWVDGKQIIFVNFDDILGVYK